MCVFRWTSAAQWLRVTNNPTLTVRGTTRGSGCHLRETPFVARWDDGPLYAMSLQSGACILKGTKIKSFVQRVTDFGTIWLNIPIQLSNIYACVKVNSHEKSTSQCFGKNLWFLNSCGKSFLIFSSMTDPHLSNMFSCKSQGKAMAVLHAVPLK